MTSDPSHWCAAFAALLVYLGLCAAVGVLRPPRKRKAPRQAASWIVAYASQTGNAEALARHTARLVQLAGMQVELLALAELPMASLRRVNYALFIVSTYGEGDPPDNAASFCRELVRTRLSLNGLGYAVLALGDRGYANYCGFGRALDERLGQLGANHLFERIDIDRRDPDGLANWQECLGRLVGTSDLPEQGAPQFGSWRLARRRHFNPGSLGGPVFHLELEPADGRMPPWQSGDLAQILVPGEDRPREYSIASIPADGSVHLLIRLHRSGAASRWLCEQALEGGEVSMRLRAHCRFRLEETAERPLILIGNGTGMAGLRGHLKARLARGHKQNWLLFGERQGACDYHYRDEISRWQREAGLLVDAVFSRDQGERLYVQDRLKEQGQRLKEWIAAGAAIYVCGSLKGMAAGVDAALAHILGAETLEELGDTGRYRRDVY